MKLQETKEYEIHSFFDIPSVVLASIKILIEKKDKKDYIIIVRKDKTLEGR